MKNFSSRLIRILLPLLLGAFILYWVYRDFDFERAFQVLRHGLRWDWMALSLFFGVWSHVERGLRWRQTLDPLGVYPRKSHLVDAIYLSYATSLVVPRLGEVSRCGVLSRYDGVPFSKSLGTVVTERMVDALCMLLIAGVTLLLELPVFLTFFHQTGTKVPSLVHLFSSPWFYVALFSVVGVVVVLVWMVRALSVFERVRGVVLDVWQGIMSLRRVRNGDVRGGYVCRHCAYAQRGGSVAFRGHYDDDALRGRRGRCQYVCPPGAWGADAACRGAGLVGLGASGDWR